jgi:predicted nucleic acid-binding protein
MLVLDTNTIIYHLAGQQEVSQMLTSKILSGEIIAVPTLVVAEFLSFPAVSENDIDRFNLFLNQVAILDLELPMAQLAGKIRRERKVPLADAIIAATVLTYGATLATRNAKDFKKVSGLNILQI